LPGLICQLRLHEHTGKTFPLQESNHQCSLNKCEKPRLAKSEEDQLCEKRRFVKGSGSIQTVSFCECVGDFIEVIKLQNM
jgi:hypothetical protein